jgi:signal recognition particle subunit SEC65
MAKATSKKKKEEVQEEVALPTVTLEEVKTVVEVTEEGTEEVIEAEAPKTEEEVKEAIVEETAAALPEVLQVAKADEPKLSKQAQGWRDWLAYQKMTPEDFLERYPAHKMRHLIEEIIRFNAQK